MNLHTLLPRVGRSVVDAHDASTRNFYRANLQSNLSHQPERFTTGTFVPSHCITIMIYLVSSSSSFCTKSRGEPILILKMKRSHERDNVYTIETKERKERLTSKSFFTFVSQAFIDTQASLFPGISVKGEITRNFFPAFWDTNENIPASFIHRLASSLQTVRKQSKISKVTCIQTVHIYIYIYVEDTLRERKGRVKKGEADIYIYIIRAV